MNTQRIITVILFILAVLNFINIATYHKSRIEQWYNGFGQGYAKGIGEHCGFYKETGIRIDGKDVYIKLDGKI